jgi:hypothetical protein
MGFKACHLQKRCLSKTLDLSLDIINYIPRGLGYFEWKLLFGIFRLGTFAWDLQAWGTGLLRLGEPVG